MHTTIADIAGTLATLCRTLDPNQFQFLLKHFVRHVVQLQVRACLCHPGELKFAKEHLTDDELYEQCGVNTVLPRPHHPDLDQVPAKHPTRALAGAIHYQLRKHMFTKFLHLRQMLQTSSRSRGRNSSQVLQNENMKQAKSRPKQRKLKWQEQQKKKKKHSRTGKTPTNCSYRTIKTNNV